MFRRIKRVIIKSALVMAIAMPVYTSIDVNSADAGSRNFRRAAVAAGVAVGGIIAFNSYRRYRNRNYYRSNYYNNGYYNNGYRSGAYYRPAFRPIRRVYRRTVRRVVRKGYYHYNHYHRRGYHHHRH